MLHSKREIELMKNYMAHVLVLNFHEESVFLSQNIPAAPLEALGGRRKGHPHTAQIELMKMTWHMYSRTYGRCISM